MGNSLCATSLVADHKHKVETGNVRGDVVDRGDAMVGSARRLKTAAAFIASFADGDTEQISARMASVTGIAAGATR